jgi:phospholipid N-methyltransferase
MKNHMCSYSPDDDKLRIYPAYRLPKEEYAQLKSAGFGWAPKQECFYAVWSPSREAMALEFADEIEDEDKSLVERAEERADRFEQYSDNRAAEAERAHKAVDAIAKNIPFGQPILVGHHSERHARRDAKRIEQGMRRAVDAWETSEYWTSRAAGALANAKYKERADVRARRIKGLEADKRKRIKDQDEAKLNLQFWSGDLPLKNGTNPGVTYERALNWCNMYDGYGGCTLPNGEEYYSKWGALERNLITVEALTAQRLASLPKAINYYQQWIDHINNRLTYERAMLAEGGGLKSDQFDFQVGGQVKHRWGWNVIKRLNKKEGRIVSVSLINNQYPTVVNVEDIKDYKAPAEGDTEKVQAATKKAPICNYPGMVAITRLSYSRNEDGPTEYAMQEITQEQWDKCHKDYKGTRDVEANDIHGKHRIRIMLKNGTYGPVFITDAKRKDAPPPAAQAAPVVDLPKPQAQEPRAMYQAPEAKPEASKFEAMKDSLKAGIQTLTAPQLFPTPPDLAEKMVEYAEIAQGMTVLEPSAGTGNILQAIMNDDTARAVIAVEINQTLCNRLKAEYILTDVHCMDFLAYNRGNYPVDRIIMNPPFENGSDIKHILHAKSMLKPGGKLVAICAGGPRQTEKLQPLCDSWELLPAGTFASAGTNVNTVLLTMSN